MKKVLTIGTFDLLHRGHIDLFNYCRELAGEGGSTFVAVNTDDFVKSYKGKAPIINEIDRLVMVDALKAVDFVDFHNHGEDCIPTIENVRPDILVIGSDWLKKNYLEQIGVTAEYLEENNIALIYTPRRFESTTEIKKRVKNES